MKVKLDENMPAALAELLRTGGHDVSTVREQGLSGADDATIIKKATVEGRVLITFDTDFGDVRAYPPGSHAGLVVFRVHDQRWAALREPAERLLSSGLIDRIQNGLAIVDESRIRARFEGEE